MATVKPENEDGGGYTREKSYTRKKNLKVIYSEAAAAFTIKMSFVLGRRRRRRVAVL